MAFIATSTKEETIGTSPVVVSEEKVLYANAERVRLILVNTSTTSQVFRIGVGIIPSTSLGIPLYAGGSIEWERSGEIPIQQKQVLAIADAAGGTLSIYEEVINKVG